MRPRSWQATALGIGALVHFIGCGGSKRSASEPGGSEQRHEETEKKKDGKDDWMPANLRDQLAKTVKPTEGGRKLDAAGGIEGALLGKPPVHQGKCIGPAGLMCNLPPGEKLAGFLTVGETLGYDHDQLTGVTAKLVPSDCPRIIAKFDNAFGIGRRDVSASSTRIDWVGDKIELHISSTPQPPEPECFLSLGLIEK